MLTYISCYQMDPSSRSGGLRVYSAVSQISDIQILESRCYRKLEVPHWLPGLVASELL